MPTLQNQKRLVQKKVRCRKIRHVKMAKLQPVGCTHGYVPFSPARSTGFYLINTRGFRSRVFTSVPLGSRNMTEDDRHEQPLDLPYRERDPLIMDCLPLCPSTVIRSTHGHVTMYPSRIKSVQIHASCSVMGINQRRGKSRMWVRSSELRP
jgi:hypothetical protein